MSKDEYRNVPPSRTRDQLLKDKWTSVRPRSTLAELSQRTRGVLSSLAPPGTSMAGAFFCAPFNRLTTFARNDTFPLVLRGFPGLEWISSNVHGRMQCAPTSLNILNMPNTTSAKKDLRQSKKRAERNVNVKEQMLYATKMVRRAVDGSNTADAQSWLLKAQQIFAKAAQKNVIKKNTASRRTSRLTRRVNALSQQK